jgi:tagaturonate epimerase
MKLGKYSFGIGDRFGKQGDALLMAMKKAGDIGIDIAPVWNKSHREHMIVGSAPVDVREEADNSVKNLGWQKPYHVDADHINLENVDLFITSSDFFTIDVADYIGAASNGQAYRPFLEKSRKFAGQLNIPGVQSSLDVDLEQIENICQVYYHAVQKASEIYNHISDKKGPGNFIAEVSMDETEKAQSPIEMFFILAMLAHLNVPLQTIAPKFSGRFNKGVDYVGDPRQFGLEFSDDLAVINFAIKEFGLPGNLKISVHSGSDKFSIYPFINKALKKFDAGIHVKTAGTTWLEELIGLCRSGEDGLCIVKKIYKEAFSISDELIKPYETVIDINMENLPGPNEIDEWTASDFVQTLNHDSGCPQYNQQFRQFFHVAYKVAADQAEEYLNAVDKNSKIISDGVTSNIFDRHILPIFK